MRNEKCHDYIKISPNITIFKSKRMRWVEHVERVKEKIYTKFLSENMKESGYLGDIGVEGKIIVIRELG